MDVVEVVFSWLPSNWWHLLITPDLSHHDDISKYLPFPTKYMMSKLNTAGLISRKSINKEKFNLKYKGRFEVTSYLKKGERQIYSFVYAERGLQYVTAQSSR